MGLTEGAQRVVFVTPCPSCGAADALVTIGEVRGVDGELIRCWLIEVDCDNDACPSSQAAIAKGAGRAND